MPVGSLSFYSDLINHFDYIDIRRPCGRCFPNWTLTLAGPPWWRHQMETFSALLALCAGNSPVPVNSLHKGQWRRALMFSLICVRINDWVNNPEGGDLRRHHAHYDVTLMTGHYVTGVSWYQWHLSFNASLYNCLFNPMYSQQEIPTGYFTSRDQLRQHGA